MLFKRLSQLDAVLLLQGGEDTGHGLVGVGVGEGLILGAQGEREADALFALGDVRALVDVEHLDALEVVAAGALA